MSECKHVFVGFCKKCFHVGSFAVFVRCADALRNLREDEHPDTELKTVQAYDAARKELGDA